MFKTTQLIDPPYNSPVTDLVIELEKLRTKELGGSTHPNVFFQLKHIFHTLESIGSARIEGNNTTIAEYIETKIDKDDEPKSASIIEIQNIEKAMSFIEQNVLDYPINRMFISELHKTVVEKLPLPPNGEGDHNPGAYRQINVSINKSKHLPPDWALVGDYMDELLDFINRKDNPKYDLLKVAIAHHKFVWIHPFGNGNGRTVRLFTYAMLVKLGFHVDKGRILNPTAVFCSHRDNYYKFLSGADAGDSEGLLNWCSYVLSGLKEEIEKIDKLLDYEYLKKNILIPAINHSLDRRYITEDESKILKLATNSKNQTIQASDINNIFPTKYASDTSRRINKLIEKKMIQPEEKGKRKYIICFENNYLLRGIIKALSDGGFLPIADKQVT